MNTRDVLQRLMTRRWLVWLLVATIAAVACVLLGRWQWGRWETKHAAQSLIKENYDAAPRPVADVLGTEDTPLPHHDEWQQVTATGSYEVGQQTLVRNRPLDGEFGYEVLIPLKLTDGRRVLVDRGWLPNGPNASTPPAVPAPASGTVTVIGWVRPGERDLDRAPIPGQTASINIPSLSASTGGPLLNGYLLMRSENPKAANSPQSLGKPDLGMAAGINLSYALQWWAGAIAMYGLVFAAARREVRDELPDETLTDASGETLTEDRQDGPGGRTVKPRKPKKVRIWDEEDA